MTSTPEQRNLFIAIVLSLLVLFGFNYFFPAQKQPGQSSPQETVQKQPLVQSSKPIFESSKDDPRIKVQTNTLSGSINLKGAIIDDLTLKMYRETVDLKSPLVALLKPNQKGVGYFSQTKWLCSDQKMPDEHTLWSTTDKTLTKESPLTLTFDNGSGLIFKKIISIDDNYLFTIEDSVISNLDKPLSLQLSLDVVRVGIPETSNFFILHEGGIGVLNHKLQEHSYKDLSTSQPLSSKGGWVGFTDKYFLVSGVPDQNLSIQASFKQIENDHIASFAYDIQTLDPSKSIHSTSSLFAGPKVLKLLDDYKNLKGIDRFDLAVDFGWFYFLTKPLFLFLNYINTLIGNFGLSILFLTVLLKILFFPLANKSFHSMNRMKTLAPKIEHLKTQYSNDRMKMNQELMELYQREKINPASGCLPMLIQAPIFFCLYKVLFVTIEMRHAPFYGWLCDLSMPDPSNIFTIFGLINWTPPSFLNIGILPLIMGLTMVIQQRLNPPPADPAQAKAMMILPVVFTLLFASFPSGLVLYWAWSNILTILQQMVITKNVKR